MGQAEIGVARRWFEEVWNQRHKETIFELMDPKAVGHTAAAPTLGPEQWKARFWEPFRQSFGDIRVTVDQALSEGEDVAVRWSASMKHVGPLFGVAPSGRTVSFSGSTWMRVRDGQIVEGWDTWDFTGLMVRLGATPEILRALTEQ